MAVMELMKRYILILLSLVGFIVCIESKLTNGYLEIDSFDDLLMDTSQREIYRRWLSESEMHGTEDGEEHHLSFELSKISHFMDEILLKYEECSEWVNQTVEDDDNSHSSPERRRLMNATSTILINEGSWSCNTTSHLMHAFENISTQIELFNELNCSHGHEEHESHSSHVPDGVYIVLYCAFVLFIGIILKYTQHRFHIPIPYTVLLLIVGAILETIEIADDDAFGHISLGFSQVRTIDPHMVLSLFIPGLIFESAFNTNYHIFLKESQQAAMLAGPGVLVNALLIGGVMHYFAHSISLFSSIDEDGYDWTWSFSIMFGAIVSATDPVAVVALLKELGASKRLSTLIEAESLLNDGTAFVMFSVLQAYAASDSGTSFASMLITFLRLAFGGAIFGIICGAVCVFAISKVYNDFEIEITISLSLVYLFAYTGDFVLKVSGVLVIVFMGLWVSKNREAISPHVEETMHHFWEMIGFIANTLLFFLTGQVIAFRIHSESQHIHWSTDICILIMLYICCHITRALAIWQMHPVLKNTGYGCTFEDSVVMVYGGLRGAIGLALALIVETEEAFDKLDRDRVLFHVCGIVTLTLVINAPTVKYVVHYLGLNKPPSDTAALFKSATQHLIDDVHHELNKMKLDKHYTGANWLKVNQLQPRYDELYKSIFDEEMNIGDHHGECGGNEELSVGSDGELIINMLAELQRADRENQQKQAVEKRVIQVMKSSYWTQYEKGLISADAVNILVESSEDAMDEHDLTKQRKNLKKWFSIPWYIKFMHQSQFRYIKKLSEWLLFGNLGFAVEIASGFVYASKSALEFCHLLIHNESIDKKHVKFVEGQLKDVTDWIEVTGSDVVRVYPEVHTAIQTKHAAHSLLNYQKEEINHLLHKGFLDESEHNRVMVCCETSLNELFHTSYTKLLDKNHDNESILLQSPLFSELTDGEKKLVVERAKPSEWFKKGQYIMREGKKTRKLFVITRGTVFVYQGNRTHIHTKERGDVLDVYALLQDNVHGFNFMVSTDQCFGYWLDLSLLKLLKDSNIDFWDTLWKCAACDVMRYYFQNESIMNGVDIADLDNIVYQSPLSFFDPYNRYRCEIRVNRGVGVLLNGQCVHITDMNTKAFAPAILPVVDEPYVAIQDSVVLYLDFNRQIIDNGKTSMLNPKLAKLMGLNASVPATDADEIIDDDDDDIIGDDDDSQFSQSEDISIDEEEKEEEEDYSEQEQQLLAGDTDKKQQEKEEKEQEFTSIIDEKKNNNLISQKPQIQRLKTEEEQQKKRKSSRYHSRLHRQESNIGQIDRLRSKKQLNRAGRKELDAHHLNEKYLPSIINRDNIENDWSIKECFEVIKFVIAKHEGLFEHVKKFHIQHLQEEILKQFTSISDEESIEMDDEEVIDSDIDDDEKGKINTGLTRPKAIKNAAKSVDSSTSTGGLNKNQSLFARPSSMKFRKKLSMPHIDPNRDPNDVGNTFKIDNKLKIRKMTLDDNKFRSSRYVLSQQRGVGTGGISLGISSLGTPIQKMRKQKSDTPAIIQPKNYNIGKRKSGRISSHYAAAAAAKRKSSKKNKTTPHHIQQSTDIDGWENIGNNINEKIIPLNNNTNNINKQESTLKDDEVNEMAKIIDACDENEKIDKP